MQKPLQVLLGKLSRFISFVVHAFSNFDQRRTSIEYRHLEEQLRKLSCAVEQSPSTIVVTDTSGKIEYVNPKFTQLTGYTYDEAIGQNPRILKTDKTPPRVYECLWKAIKSGHEWRGEFCNKKKNGELYWESASISPVKNSEGTITHFVAVKEDITVHKRMEQALRALNESLEKRVVERTKDLRDEIIERRQKEEELQQYGMLFDNISDLAYICDTEGRIVFVNREFERLSGSKPEDAVGKTFVPFFDEENLKKAMDVYKRTLKGESPQYELCFRDTGILCEYKNLPLRDKDEKIIGIFGVARDITERKRAEETLLLRSKILENMNEGVSLVRACDGIIVYTNTQFNNLFGYEHGELVGRYVSILNAPVQATPQEKAQEIIRELNDKGSWSGEICNVKKDGTAFWCRANVSRFDHTEYGDVWVSVHEDITERKKADEQIKASLKEKEVLLDEVHHRVKNNLQIISSLLDMSSMKTQNQETIELFKESRNRVNSMALIHSQLYESERFDKIDMEKHIQELSGNLLKVYSKEQTITLDIKAANVYFPVTQAVPCALVLNELISNTLKHAYRDGQKGTISIMMEQPNNATTLLRVKDDGLGIPVDIDIDSIETLGLKLVRNIIYKQLNGKMKIIRNKGTEFIIELKGFKEDA